MSIIIELLKEVPSSISDDLEKIMIICNKIKEEEDSTLKLKGLEPKGPNVLLSCEVPGRYEWEAGFLTLEREDPDTYIAAYYSIEINRINHEDLSLSMTPRKKKVWVIKEYRPEKVFKAFGEKLKYVKGE